MPDALPHGELTELLPDVFFVTGTSRATFLGRTWQFSRNMVVVRHGEELTLLNSVRLDAAGLARLDALGRTVAVLRLGAYHGIDDAFYLSRGPVSYLAPAGAPPADGARAADGALEPGAALPMAGGQVFRFETSRVPEVLIWLPTGGGTLVSCDSLQNWVAPDAYFDAESAAGLAAMGFIGPANIGPGWRLAAEPQAEDFARLMTLDFANLLPGHGAPMLGDARAQLARTFAREFGL